MEDSILVSLVNPSTLPVSAHEERIIDSVMGNQVTIITAETGSGKTTLVPPMFWRAGFRVACTQPRRLAARSIASHTAQQEGCIFGGPIGYRTGFERNFSAETRLLYTTDGTELVREIVSDWQPEILIIDEVHEWGVETEALVAWAKKRLKEGASFRLIVMSATLEAERLSQYFDNAPVISVEGRLFSVEERSMSTGSVEDEVAQAVAKGRNILVFQPGKKEIVDCIDRLKAMQAEAVILPLHGDLSPEEQDLVFRDYDLPKIIVATNVAETSVTVPDIDLVIDTQLEKRVETKDGVEGLYVCRISKAQAKQRMGRAGRCKEGTYINCYGGWEGQEDFPKAEIERVRLDQLILRLACHGIKVMELEFFHQPDRAAMAESYRTLRILGAVTLEGEATSLGKLISRWPVSVNYAKTLVLAKEVRQLPAMRRIVACLEVGGIQSRIKDGWMKLPPYIGSSDAVAQYYCYQLAAKLPKNPEVFEENGLSLKHYRRAQEIERKLQYLSDDRGQNEASAINDELMAELVVSGMLDRLHMISGYGLGGSKVSDGRKDASLSYGFEQRQLSNRSVVSNLLPGQLVIGEPIDITIKGRYGFSKVLKLLTMATSVLDPRIVVRHAPHCAVLRRYDWRWCSSEESLSCSLSLSLEGAHFELPDNKEYMGFDELKALVGSGDVTEAEFEEICYSVARRITEPGEAKGLPQEILSKIKLRSRSTVELTANRSRYGVSAQSSAPSAFGTGLAGLLKPLE
ncbi:MAG: helicase-related protein [Patescibacteria group bacterium]|jgi:HrpA-like RNA helicase